MRESLVVVMGTVVEGRGTEKRDKDVCSEIDIVIYHQDRVSGGTGAREQDLALVSEVMFQEIGSGVVHHGGHRVMERHRDAVYLRCHGSDITVQGQCVTRGEVFLDDRDIGVHEGLDSAHKELEVKVHVVTCVAVSSVVYVCCHGDVEEKEVVIDIKLCKL